MTRKCLLHPVCACLLVLVTAGCGEFRQQAFPIEKKFFALGERYVTAADTDISNLARALFVHHQHFFTFVHEEGVEPTNNAAERALRTAVQWRKIMFGNRSAAGELAVARLLTI